MSIHNLRSIIKNGQIDTLKEYLEAGGDPNFCEDSFQENLLYRACDFGQEQVYFLLLSYGADIEALGNVGQTVMEAACRGGNEVIINDLIDTKQQSIMTPSRANSSLPVYPISLLFKYEHWDIIESLVSRDLITQTDLITGNVLTAKVLYASKEKKLKKIIDLFEPLQPDIHKALVACCKSLGAKKALVLLDKYDIMPSLTSEDFLKILDNLEPCYVDDEALEDMAVFINPELDYQGEIYSCHSPLLEYYLEKGISINAVDENGETLLHKAACLQLDGWENMTAVHFIVQLKADLNAKNAKGQTPLMLALQEGYAYHALYLISCGAGLEAVDNTGKSVLDYAKAFPKEEYGQDYRQIILNAVNNRTYS